VPSKNVVLTPTTEPAHFYRQMRTKVIAIGDFHAPFHHRAALSWVLATIEEEQPEVVVQMGDLYDLYGFSKYPRSHNIMTPNAEMDEARAHAEFLWSEVRRLSRGVSCYQLMGNHDDRAMKRIIERSPEHERFVYDGVKEFYSFEGVTTVDDSSEELEIDGVLYHHGHRSQIGQHAAWNRQCTVNGHLHRGGVVYSQEKAGTIWELNAGWLGDREAPVFSYHSQKKRHGTTLGLGLVDSNGPRFMPYAW
jgi:predicted MPP superfamily phosphohydrolase